jgi:DNA-directed RNA polymerase subunit RPC12/RpoP
MNQSLECPRCHRQVEDDGPAGNEDRRCPRCRLPLILVAAPAEAIVRGYLYGHGLPPLRGGDKLRA